MNMHNRIHWSHFKTSRVTVSVRPRPIKCSALFMVSAVIDQGNGKKQIVLKDPEFLISSVRHLVEPVRVLPESLCGMRLIYTGQFGMHMSNPHKALAEFYKTGNVEQIVPDVLSPGDFIICARDDAKSAVARVESLRVMTEQKQDRYAL